MVHGCLVVYGCIVFLCHFTNPHTLEYRKDSPSVTTSSFWRAFKLTNNRCAKTKKWTFLPAMLHYLHVSLLTFFSNFIKQGLVETRLLFLMGHWICLNCASVSSFNLWSTLFSFQFLFGLHSISCILPKVHWHNQKRNASPIYLLSRTLYRIFQQLIFDYLQIRTSTPFSCG